MEQLHIRVPDGTKERIRKLGVPGGPSDFVKWALEYALQEQERDREARRIEHMEPPHGMTGGGRNGFI